MNELRLVFGRSTPSGDYPVQVVRTSGNASRPVSFKPFLTVDDYDDLRWYLEEFMDLPDGGSLTRAQRIEVKLHEWGRRLHDAIFKRKAEQSLLAQLLGAATPRVLTIGTQDPALLRLPWELIADEAGLLASRVSVRRQLERPDDLVSRTVRLPLRILCIVSRPGDTGFVDPRLATRSLVEATDSLGSSVRIDFCRPATLGVMEEMLRAADTSGEPYGLVHFDGHGTFIAESESSALYFEKHGNGAGGPGKDPVGADRLADLLAQHKIPLVILNACRSASVGETSIFRSVAPRLIQAGVDSVLAMGHAVHGEAAGGYSIGSTASLREARRSATPWRRRAAPCSPVPIAGSSTARPAAVSRFRTGFCRNYISAESTDRCSRSPLRRRKAESSIHSTSFSATITRTPSAWNVSRARSVISTACASGSTSGSANRAPSSASARSAS